MYKIFVALFFLVHVHVQYMFGGQGTYNHPPILFYDTEANKYVLYINVH